MTLRRASHLLGFIAFAALLPQPSHAACTNPAGVAGAIIYNTDFNVLQYCNDTDWVGVGSRPAGGALTVQGSNTQVQFNDGGSTAGGATQLLWDKTNNRLGVGSVSAPTRTLDVTGTTAADTLVMKSVTGAAVPLTSPGSATAITALTGNVVAQGPGAVVATIANSAVTYSKMQNVSGSNRLLGRATSGAGPIEEITLGAGLSYTGTTLNSTGAQSSGTAGYLQFNNAGGVFASSGTTAGQQLFWDGTNHRLGVGNVAPAYPLDITGTLRTSGELITTFANAFRMAPGTYGAFFRNDGTNTYALLTNSGDQYGTWNTFRPLTIDNALGDVYLNLFSAPTTNVYKYTSGYMGVGTHDPQDPIDVRASNSRYGVRVDDANGLGLQIQGQNPVVNFNAYWDGTSMKAMSAGFTGQVGVEGSNLNFKMGTNVAAGATTTMTDRLRIDTDGKVLVNPGTAWGQLSVEGANADGQIAFRHSAATAGAYVYVGPDSSNRFVVDAGSTGGVYITYGGTSWTANSDERLKKDIAVLPNALEKLGRIRGVSYLWKDENKSTKTQLGVIAQEVQKEYPEIVSERDGILGVGYTEFVAPLIEAVKELKNLNDKIEADNIALEKRITALEAQRP